MLTISHPSGKNLLKSGSTISSKICLLSLTIFMSSLWGGNASQASENLIGRWYGEYSQIQHEASENAYFKIHICVSTEYFRNKKANFQGEMRIHWFIPSDKKMDVSTSYSVRGAVDWSLLNDELTETIIDMRKSRNSFTMRVDDEIIDPAYLTGSEKEDYNNIANEIDKEVSNAFFNGMTTTSKLIYISKNNILSETKSDDGSPMRIVFTKTERMLSACR